MSSKPTLTDMPDVAMKTILGKVGFRSFLTLRNVCRDLRNFIDDIKPEASTCHLSISMNLESIKMDMPFDLFSVEYKTHKKGSETICNISKKRKVVGNKDFPSVFMEDFKIILRHLKSVDNLYIYFKRTTIDPIENQEFITNQLLETMKQSLKSRLRPLSVKRIHLGTVTQNEVMSVLPYLDAKSLESIEFVNSGAASFNSMELNEIVKLDQWKNAKRLEMYKLINSAPIQHFCHFSKVSIVHETVSRDVLLLKEILLDPNTVSTLDSFRITFKYMNIRHLRSLLDDQPLSPEETNVDTWFFGKPGKGKTLKLTVSHFSEYWSLCITQS